MKNDKNTITWMAGKNVCEFDTSTWNTKVHPTLIESFTYSFNGPVVEKSGMIQYSGNRATDCSDFICKGITMKGSITSHRPLFRKKGNYTITLLEKNVFEYSDTLVNALHAEPKTKMVVPDAFSDQTNVLNNCGMGIGSNLRSIHEEFYNNWVDRIFEFFELDDSWEGTFRGQSESKNGYAYMIDFKGTVGE